jgi:Kef-type K+ transport system membrane component KefB
MTLELGAVIVAFLSAGLGALWGLRPEAVARYSAAAVAPFVVSYLVYWLPELGRSNATASSEHGGWSLLVIGGWYIIGLIVSVFSTVVSASIYRKYGRLNGREHR